MRKILFMLSFVFCMLVSFNCNTCMAATKSDVISAINATYNVAGKNFRLPAKYIALGEEYLSEKELSSKQYDSILYYISEAVNFAREVGTTDYDKLTDEQKRRAAEIVFSAAMAADATEELNEITNPEPSKPVEENKPQNSVPVVNQGTNIDSEKIETSSDNKQDANNKVENNTSIPEKIEPNKEITSGEGLKENITSGEVIKNENTSTEVSEFKKLLAGLDIKTKNTIFYR